MSARSRLLAVLFAWALCSSLLAGAVGPAAVAPARADPPGYTSVPDAQITDKIPEYALEEIPSAAAFEDGNVLASQHAGSLAVEVTTAAAAHGRAGACKQPQPDGQQPAFCSSPQLALNLTDTSHHAGRQVAVNATLLEDALGYVPAWATVEHRASGETYRERLAVVEDGGERYVVLDVRGFSTNTVVFGSRVELTGSPAINGTSYQYTLEDAAAVDNVTANVTGTVREEWDNETAPGLENGSSTSISLAGDELGGPAAGDAPRLSVTGHAVTRTSWNGSTTRPDGGYHLFGAYVSGSDYYKSETRLDHAPANITSITIHITTWEYNQPEAGAAVDVYIVNGDSVNNNYGQGTLVANNWEPAGTTGNQTIQLDTPFQPTAENVTVEFRTVSSTWSQNSVAGPASGGPDGYSLNSHTTEGGAPSYSVVAESPAPDSVNITADDGTTTGTLGPFTDGETAATAFNVTQSATQLDVSASSGVVDVDLAVEERTYTPSGALEVNSNSSAFGALSPGETVTLSGIDASDIQAGTNRVNVSLDESGLSTDAPTPGVELVYSHTANVSVSTDYTGEQWSERYNVSHTYASDRENASLTVPFAGNVVGVRTLTLYLNGTETAVTYSHFDGTTLEVGIGDVTTNTTARVVANGTKVVTHNSSITVLEPTPVGSTLDSKVRLDSWNAGAYLAVGGTPSGDRVHHTYNESWTADDRVVVEPGKQRLKLPNAAAGSTFRVSTIPLAANPESGEVVLSVEDAGGTPEFKVEPGATKGDTVEFVWYDTVSGTKYILKSKSAGVQRASDTAESPAYLPDDDSSELLVILTEDGGSTNTDDPPPGPNVPPISSGSPLDVPVALVATLAGLAGLALVGNRYLESELMVAGLVATGGLVALVVLTEAVTPQAMLAELLAPLAAGVGSGLARITAFAGLAAVILGGWWFYANFIKGSGPRPIQVVGRLRGGKK